MLSYAGYLLRSADHSVEKICELCGLPSDRLTRSFPKHIERRYPGTKDLTKRTGNGNCVRFVFSFRARECHERTNPVFA